MQMCNKSFSDESYFHPSFSSHTSPPTSLPKSDHLAKYFEAIQSLPYATKIVELIFTRNVTSSALLLEGD
jgi:hypothetical protein